MADLALIDTDILIDAARGEQGAVATLKRVEQETPPAISVVTQMELIVGCRNKREARSLARFLSRFRIVNLDSAICQRAVNLLRQHRLSHGLLIADALIAATAIESRAVLLSGNGRDYRFIEGLRLLRCPD